VRGMCERAQVSPMCDLAGSRGGSGGLPPTTPSLARFRRRRQPASAAAGLPFSALALYQPASPKLTNSRSRSFDYNPKDSQGFIRINAVRLKMFSNREAKIAAAKK
jgi:hypothetical protein